jgi:osmotically-inducible protein OsmY
MAAEGIEAPEYVAEHLRAAFATDSRIYEQGLDVTVRGRTIVVQGTVSTPALREAVTDVASELVPGAEVLNEVEVPPNPEPGTAEDLG